MNDHIRRLALELHVLEDFQCTADDDGDADVVACYGMMMDVYE